MATFTSKAAGDWSASGQTTWNEAGVPASGDTVTVNHAITVDTNTTVGAGGASGTVALTVNATLTIASGVAFDVRGSIDYNNASIQYTSGGAGGRLRLADCPDGGTYSHNIGKAHNQGSAFLYIVGNSGTPFTLDFTPAGTTGIGYIENGGFIGGGQVRVQYADVTLGSSGNDIEFYPRNSTAWNYYWKNCTFTSCGSIRSSAGFMGASGYLNMLDNKHITTAGTYPFSLTFYNAKATGERNILRCDFDRTPYLGSPADLTIDYCLLRDGAPGVGSLGGAQWDAFSNSVYVKDHQSDDLIYGSMLDVYVAGTYSGTNMHGFQPAVNCGSITLDGLFFDLACSDASGDMISPQTADTSSRTITVQNCIMPASRNGGHSPGLLCSFQNPASGLTVNIYHNSIYESLTSAEGGAIARLGETQVTYPGLIPNLKSNLAIGPVDGYIVKHATAGNVADATVTDADYNAGWNSSGGGAAFTDNYQPANAKFGSTPGTHDVAANPQLVDIGRNLLTYTGEATVTDALDALWDTGDIETAIDALFAYVRGGWTPQNPAYDSTAHDGGTIGAVAYSAVSGVSGTATMTVTFGLTAAGTVAGSAGAITGSAAMAVTFSVAAAGLVGTTSVFLRLGSITLQVEEIEERTPEPIGDEARSFSGSLRGAISAEKRSWRVRLYDMSESDYQTFRSATNLAQQVTATGTALNSAFVTVRVELDSADYVHDGASHLRAVAFTMDEV